MLALTAAMWGGIAGLALVIGAAIGFFASVPQRATAAVMAFGGGVLVSALSFDLIEEAYRRSGPWIAAAGFVSGAAIFTPSTFALNRGGARHRKRSGTRQPSDREQPGSGLLLALGALIDGIPESIAIGRPPTASTWADMELRPGSTPQTTSPTFSHTHGRPPPHTALYNAIVTARRSLQNGHRQAAERAAAAERMTRARPAARAQIDAAMHESYTRAVVLWT